MLLRKHLRLALLTLVIAPASAQMTTVNQPPTPAADHVPTFDVVSIKPNKSGTGLMRSMSTPDGISVTNFPLLPLIRQAYNIFNASDDRISGVPDWVKDQRFDIEAKVAPADVDALSKLNREQRGQMLQALLADRFHLKAHPETKELPVYYLVVAKGGSKLKEAKPGDTYANGIKGPDGVGKPGMMRMSNTRLDGQALSISSLLSFLTQLTGRTVLDKTGLTGKYDMTLEWTPEENSPVQMKPGAGAPPPTGNESAPSIFTAVQEQLGLKLESGKGPVEGLAIDHIEQPSEN